jgi:hypothetical protein
MMLLLCMLILSEWDDGGGVFRAFSSFSQMLESVFQTVFRFATKHQKIINFFKKLFFNRKHCIPKQTEPYILFPNHVDSLQMSDLILAIIFA